MRLTDDDCHIKSDNSDTRRLDIKINPGVVLTVCPRDRSVSQLLHNKPMTIELTANIPLAVMELIHFAPSSCKD